MRTAQDMRPQPAPDLTRIQSVTANYRQLQGLRWLPLGVALLLATPLYAGWQFAPGGVLLALWLLPLALGLALHRLVAAYYARTFGWVQPLSRPSLQRGEEIVLWAVLLASLPLSQRMGGTGVLLVAVSVVACGLMVLPLRHAGSLRLRRHWPLLALLLAGATLALVLPLAPLHPERWSLYTPFALWVATLSLCLIIGGVLDDRLLRRSLAAAAEDGHAGPI